MITTISGVGWVFGLPLAAMWDEPSWPGWPIAIPVLIGLAYLGFQILVWVGHVLMRIEYLFWNAGNTPPTEIHIHQIEDPTAPPWTDEQAARVVAERMTLLEVKQEAMKKAKSKK